MLMKEATSYNLYLERSSSSSSSSPSDSLSSTSFKIDAGPTAFPLYFFFLRPNSSYSPSDSSLSMYSTFSLSLKPPPYPKEGGAQIVIIHQNHLQVIGKIKSYQRHLFILLINYWSQK